MCVTSVTLALPYITFTLHYIQIYNVPYVSIRKRICSAAMAPERLHIALTLILSLTYVLIRITTKI